MRPQRSLTPCFNIYPKIEECPPTKFGGGGFNLNYPGASRNMKLVAHFVRRNVVRLVAIASVVALYLLAQQPSTGQERESNQKRFSNFHSGTNGGVEVSGARDRHRKCTKGQHRYDFSRSSSADRSRWVRTTQTSFRGPHYGPDDSDNTHCASGASLES